MPRPSKKASGNEPAGKDGTSKDGGTMVMESTLEMGGNPQGEAEATESFSARAQELGLPDWVPSYLSNLIRTCGQKGASAKAANVGFVTVYDWRQRSRPFAELERAAMSATRTVAEDEARRRAIDGVVTSRTTTVSSTGNTTIVERIEFSDTILLRLMEKEETGSWRQKQQIEHSTTNQFATRAERKAALEKARADARASEERSLRGTPPTIDMPEQ